jgi:hypothetical protein
VKTSGICHNSQGHRKPGPLKEACGLSSGKEILDLAVFHEVTIIRECKILINSDKLVMLKTKFHI